MEHPKRFSSRNRFGLTNRDVARKFQDVASEFPEMTHVPLARILEDMVDNVTIKKPPGFA